MTASPSLVATGPAAGAQRLQVTFTPPPTSYDILIGSALLENAGALIRERLGARNCLIVTDENVAPLYAATVEASLKNAGHSLLGTIAVTPGEASKSLIGIHELVSHIFEHKVDRGTLLIALGGGVVGDLAGFAASMVLRGIDFVQIPTTLLAQVDSSVGGKTGINSIYGKNTVGAFYQPRLVLADVATLGTLPRRELLSGYAEVVKHGLMTDASLFEWFLAHGQALIDGDDAARVFAVTQSCAIKARIVAADEREGGVRALLNLGHTFAHPLESVTGYGDLLLHGEAVAMGCIMAFRLSAALGHCEPQDAATVEAHFASVGLPMKPPSMTYNIDQLMELMGQDKKARDGRLTMILVKGIGQSFIQKDVPFDAVRAVWHGFVG